MEANEVAVRRQNWFELMEGYVVWKVVGPEITNPFASPIPDNVLVQLASRSEKLMGAMTLRCLCDGHEVLQIKNLAKPIFITEHPSISAMPKDDVLRHLTVCGVEDIVRKELARIQGEIKNELERRDVLDRQEALKREASARRRKAKERLKGFKPFTVPPGGMFRILKK